MTPRTASAMLPAFAAAIFLTCGTGSGYANVGPGQGTVLGMDNTSLVAALTRQDARQDGPEVVSPWDGPLIYDAMGPGQGTVLGA
jgi:hypothetical protein